MVNINKFLFVFSCLFISVCNAETFITFDSVALDTAMNEITRVGSDSPYKTVEEAGEAFYDAFYAAKKNNTVDIDKVADKCANEIIKSGRICNNFITAYNTHLDKANYCLKANNFEAKYNNKSYSFQECYAKFYGSNTYFHRDGSIVTNPNNPEDGQFGASSMTGQCQQWVKAAEQCQSYLTGYYQDKLDNSKLSKSDKKYYECLLEKVQTGNMDFPLSKMKNDCDPSVQEAREAAAYEMYMSFK